MRKWWQEAIGYQIYPKTFFDSNHDGIGDLKGIVLKLDYLESLGVDLLWICPFLMSPMDDNGYDVSDYFTVNPIFGSNEDIAYLIEEVHKRGMHIVMDFVLNHTSDEHPWFIESKSSLKNAKREYYIWKSGKNGKAPTNWASFFDDSAWTYDEESKEYYLRIFSKKMPDLNWGNPKMREDLFSVAKFWLDKGIDGFRMDAISHLAKEKEFLDSTLPLDHNGNAPDWNKFSNQPELFSYLQEMKQSVFSQYDCVSIGEVSGYTTVETALKYSGYEYGCMNMVFTFDHCWENGIYGKEDVTLDGIVTNVKNMKWIFNHWYQTFHGKAWQAQYWLNHDHPRVVSQYGDEKEYHNISAKMLCNTLYFMPGTPFVYNGEEIGMTNVDYQEVEDFNDIWVKNFSKTALNRMSYQQMIYYLQKTSRVNARTPMQWNNQKYAGFSTVKPAQKVIENYKIINVEQQEKDSCSILNHYKKVLSLRKNILKNLVLDGDFIIEQMEHEDVFAYKRKLNHEELYVISNFRKYEVEYFTTLNDFTVLFNNYSAINLVNNGISLKPFQSLVFLKNG